MIYKPNQRVAYYRVTGKSDPCPAQVDVGGVLIDKIRGKVTTWNFYNSRTGEAAWLAGVCIGYARVDRETMRPVPEPALQAVLDSMREAGCGSKED